MATIKLKAPSGGSVSLVAGDTASDVVFTIPPTTSTIVTSDILAAPTGSGLVGYVPSGAGAVATTVGAELALSSGVRISHWNTDTSGATDVTAKFTLAKNIAGVDGKVIVGPGTYLLNGLTLDVSGQEWEFQKGAIIQPFAPLTTASVIISAQFVTLTGRGKFDHAQSNAIGEYFLGGCVRIAANFTTIKNLTFNGARSYCIYGNGVSYIDIRDNTFTDTWYAAVFLEAVSANMSDISITGNRVINTTVFAGYKYGFNVHNNNLGGGSAKTVKDFIIANNILEFPASSSDYPLPIEVYGGDGSALGVSPGSVSNFSITGNSVSGGGIGISMSAAIHGTCTGNTVRNTYYSGIESVNPVGITITGNTVDTTQYGIDCSQAGDGLVISGNSVKGATVRSIRTITSQAISAGSIQGGLFNVNISGNNLNQASGAFCIQIAKCVGVSVTGNTLTDNGTTVRPLVLELSQRAVVTGNSIRGFDGGFEILGAETMVMNWITATSNVFFSTAGSDTFTQTLSGGASIGQFVSYINNQTDVAGTSTSFRNVTNLRDNIIELIGTGSPESVYPGGVGSIFRRTDAATTLYIKQTGTGNTGWAAK